MKIDEETASWFYTIPNEGMFLTLFVSSTVGVFYGTDSWLIMFIAAPILFFGLGALQARLFCIIVGLWVQLTFYALRIEIVHPKPRPPRWLKVQTIVPSSYDMLTFHCDDGTVVKEFGSERRSFMREGRRLNMRARDAKPGDQIIVGFVNA
ncbi:MAG: hypothetical protein J6333_07270 [Planctomycetes bacterium]|nr:hypothetical protein [Planctomycetota bacterium]